MGNRVIKISGNYDNSKNDENLEVYKDISIIADRKIVKNSDKEKSQKLLMAKEINVKAVFDSIRNIFTWVKGERILNPDFGSKLRMYLYEGITEQNREQIVAEIRGVCFKWEPRVNIIKVVPIMNVQNDEDNTVQMDIIFSIPSLSDEQYKYSYIYNRTE